MGGNALQNKSIILNSPDYYYLASKLMFVFRTRMPYIKIDLIPSYTDKLSFGDMDIIHQSFTEDDWDIIDEILKPTEIVKNGPVRSYGYETEHGIFQIDFISSPLSEYDFALSYYSFNDLGNLLGRIAHAAGFKLKHNGLKYIVKSPTNSSIVLGEISVCDDWFESLNFLGYENQYETMGSLEDISKYVISGKYFDKKYFLLENRNHRIGVRDAKRKTYMEFLEYCRTTVNQIEAGTWYKINREEFFVRAGRTFGNFDREYQTIIQNAARIDVYKKKYNGVIVSDVTGLSGKELGIFIQYHITQYDKNIFMDNILRATDIMIISDIQTKYKEFQHQNA